MSSGQCRHTWCGRRLCGGLLLCRLQGRNHGVAWPIGLHLTIAQHENAIELAGRGRGALSDLLTRYGSVKRAPLMEGYFHEFRVEADFFLLKPTASFISDKL